MDGEDELAREEIERAKARRGRNLALAWALAGIMALFFVMTLVRLGGAGH